MLDKIIKFINDLILYKDLIILNKKYSQLEKRHLKVLDTNRKLSWKNKDLLNSKERYKKKYLELKEKKELN
jgi:hypothetical protein